MKSQKPGVGSQKAARRPAFCLLTLVSCIQTSSSFSNTSRTASSGCVKSVRSFNSSTSGNWPVAAAEHVHRVLPVDGAALAGQREQVRIALAVVVVHVRRADLLLHQLERLLHAFAQVGVAGVEHVVQPHVRQLLELQQSLRTRQLVGNIFQQHFHAPLPREQAQLFQRRKGRIELAHIELLAAHAQVLDQVAERNHLRDFQRALDFVHHLQPPPLHRLGDGNHRMRPRPAPDLVGVHRRVQRMQLQVRIAEPVAQLRDLRLVAIIQVLPRAENLHGGNPGLLDPPQQRRGQPVVHEQVRR